MRDNVTVPATSPSRWTPTWVPAALSAATLAAVAAYGLRDMLHAGADHLPGTDTGNLYAWEIFTRAALAQGHLPFWNPYLFGGTPHLADTQTTVLYPPALMLRWVATPFQYFPLLIGLHVWLSGIGGVFLGRVVGLGWLMATAVGLATMLGGSVAPWIHNGHLLLLACASWMPCAMALAILAVRRQSVWPSAGLVAVLVLQFLAGYVQGSIYLSFAVCSYFVFSALWPETTGQSRRQPILALATLALVTCGVAAFQLFPMARLASEAGRTVGLPYSTAVAAAWSWSDLGSFFFPEKSASDRVAYVGWALACFAPAAFLDRNRRRLAVFFSLLIAGAVALTLGDRLLLYRLHYLVFPGFRIPGRVLFVAVPALAICGAIGLQRCLELARAGAWRPVLVTIAAGAAAVLVGWMLSLRGSSALPLLAWWMPVVTVGAVAAVLLARWRLEHVALLLCVVVVAVDLLARLSGNVTFADQTPPETLRQWVGPADGGRMLSACDHKANGVDLLMAGHPTVTGMGGTFLRGFAEYNERMTSEGFFPSRRDLWDAANVTRIFSCDPLSAPGLTLVSDGPPFKMYRNDTAWPRAIWTCGLEQLTEWEVSERLREGRYENRRLIRNDRINIRWRSTVVGAGREALERQYGLVDAEHRDGTTWQYRMSDTSHSNIKALLGDPAVEDTHGIDRDRAQLAPPADSDSSNRNQMLVGTTSCDGDGRVNVSTTDRADGTVRAHVEATTAGYVVLSEAYYPERHGFVDGKRQRVWRTNLAFMSVAVPAGAHDVELRFVPTSFYAGLATSGMTLLGWVGLGGTRRRRRRRSPQAPAPSHASARTD